MNKPLITIATTFAILGIIAAWVGNKPTYSDADIAMSFAEFDEVIAQPVPKITAVELAEFLIKQEHHYNLIDVSADTTDTYVIPTAERYTQQDFLQKKVAINERIFLVSQTETESIQLYYRLLAKGYFRVKVLSGGINQWKRDILNPELSAPDDTALLQHQEQSVQSEAQSARIKLSEFFGGTVKQSGRTTQTAPSLQGVLIKKKHKKHKGC